jgi:hypothetical protein
LIEVGVPLLEEFLVEFGCIRQVREKTRRGEVTTIHPAEQFGARDREVLRITRPEEELAFVGTGAAADADVHVDAQGLILFQQFAELGDGAFLPVGRALGRQVDGGGVFGFARVAADLR